MDYLRVFHKFPVYGTIKLYCIVLYCIVLYCIVLYCIVSYTVQQKHIIIYQHKRVKSSLAQIDFSDVNNEDPYYISVSP